MGATETIWDDVFDGLDLSSGNGDDRQNVPSWPPTPDDGQVLCASSRPGYTDKGERSALIRTRRADLMWFLTAPVVMILAAIATLALGGAAIMLYAVPSVEVWWQEQTNPPDPPVTEPQEPVVNERDGDPVLYGVDDVEVDYESNFDPMDGVGALDPQHGAITSDIEIRGEIDTDTSGAQVIRYGIEDSAGNTAHRWRTISVGQEPEPEEEVEPEPTQQPPPPPAPSRVSTSQSVTCTGEARITFSASGGGNVVLSGAASGSGPGSASGSTSVTGRGTVSATATADSNVRLEYEWAGTGRCS